MARHLQLVSHRTGAENGSPTVPSNPEFALRRDVRRQSPEQDNIIGRKSPFAWASMATRSMNCLRDDFQIHGSIDAAENPEVGGAFGLVHRLVGGVFGDIDFKQIFRTPNLSSEVIFVSEAVVATLMRWPGAVCR